MNLYVAVGGERVLDHHAVERHLVGHVDDAEAAPAPDEELKDSMLCLWRSRQSAKASSSPGNISGGMGNNGSTNTKARMACPPLLDVYTSA